MLEPLFNSEKKEKILLYLHTHGESYARIGGQATSVTLVSRSAGAFRVSPANEKSVGLLLL